MTSTRLGAIGLIYVFTALGWFTLGGTIVSRTGQFDSSLANQVERLWGGHHQQLAPEVWVERKREVTEDVQEKDATGAVVSKRVSKTVTDRAALLLGSSRIDVDLMLEPRRKGLLWYDTYAVRFAGHYRVRNPDAVERDLGTLFAFPSTQAIYDGFQFRVNGTTSPAVSDLSQGIVTRVTLPAGGEAEIDIEYRSRGLGEWSYAFAKNGVSQVDDFRLAMTTNFDAIDFPAGGLSPTNKTAIDDGWSLVWEFKSLVSGQRVGMDAPDRPNPGPLAARITFFAPVSLLFFLTVLVILGMLRERNLHPMNYFFIAAAFFSFHLLLAYLVDLVDINVAFAIASAASVFLVVSYLRIVGGARFALLEAGLAQLVYLVLFSYAFFFEGKAGLTITIGAVVTLFVLMQSTARVDWAEIFARKETGGRKLPPRPVPSMT